MPPDRQLPLLFGPPPPARLQDPRPSEVGLRTSVEKLNGQVYTPLPVARRMLDRVAWPRGGGRLLDPSCGEGVFLEAALHKLGDARLPADEARQRVADLVGWDVNGEALAAAGERLAAVARDLGLHGARPRLEHRDALEADEAGFAAVVGNPPYLEAKRMPDALKARIRAACPLTGRGAFDLFGAFLERAATLVAHGGETCFIVPNRLLVLTWAGALRRRLLETGPVTLLDLSTERIFPDAAVYPVVIHHQPGRAPAYTVEDWGGAAPPVRLAPAPILDHPGAILPLPPPAPGGRRLFGRTFGSSDFRPLGAIFAVRWCVSFHRAGLRDRYVFDAQPEGALAPRPFLGGGRFAGNREVSPFRIRWGGAWIDYDTARARADGNPLPSPDLFRPPVVVVCQNARRARAALDREGVVLKDTFLSVRCLHPEDEAAAWPEWLVLVLNSRLFQYLYEHLYGGTRKGGGFLHFLPAYLDPFPIPPPPDPAAVRRVHDALAAGEGDPEAAEALVRAAWDLAPDEARDLDAWPCPDA